MVRIMQPKFVLNIKSNTLHSYDGCHHAIAGVCVTKDQRGVHYIDTLIVENLYFPFVFPHPISTTTETSK